jgi:hypothetical protein
VRGGAVVDILMRTPQAEIRLSHEEQRYSAISTATLQYMLEYGISREAWLHWQHGLLAGFAEDEADLYEAMRLSERLTRVTRNVVRVSAENERIRSALLSRTLEDG